MEVQDFIRKQIFEGSALHGFSRQECERLSIRAVDVWRKSNLPNGVRFNELLDDAIKNGKHRVIIGSADWRLIKAMQVERIIISRGKGQRKNWSAFFTENSALSVFKVKDDTVQRF